MQNAKNIFFVAHSQNEAPQKRCFFRSGRGIDDSHHSSRSERGSHLSESHRGARSPVAKRKIFVKDEYPYSRPSSDGLFFFSRRLDFFLAILYNKITE